MKYTHDRLFIYKHPPIRSKCIESISLYHEQLGCHYQRSSINHYQSYVPSSWSPVHRRSYVSYFVRFDLTSIISIFVIIFVSWFHRQLISKISSFDANFDQQLTISSFLWILVYDLLSIIWIYKRYGLLSTRFHKTFHFSPFSSKSAR